MKQNTLGIVLSYYRKKYNVSQEQLCDGICSKATLSRIEKGYQETDSLVSECLLGRVGKEVTQFEIILNEEDYLLWILREEIKRDLNEKEYDKVERKLSEYSKKTESKHPLHRQFYLYQNAMLYKNMEKFSEEVFVNLFEALSISKPDFGLGKRKGELYNSIEIEIILELIKSRYKNWDNETAKIELLEMIDYVKQKYSDKKKSQIAIEIYMQLIELELDNEKKIKYVDEALEILVKDSNMNDIAKLHFIKARSLEQQYRKTAEWKYKKKNVKEECMMAYAVSNIMGNIELEQEIKDYSKEKLDWQITM